MAFLQDWIELFVGIHTKRYIRHDWPSEDTEEWGEYIKMWMIAFAPHRITEDEADLASLRLAGKPPKWREQHIPAVVEEALAARPKVLAMTSTDDRGEAERMSRGCEQCSGCGLTTAFHPRYAGKSLVEVVDRSGEVIKQPGAVSCHCYCPMGRWMRNHSAEEDRRRIVDADEIRSRRSVWLLKDPTVEEFVRTNGRITSIQELRAYMKFGVQANGPVRLSEIGGVFGGESSS